MQVGDNSNDNYRGNQDYNQNPGCVSNLQIPEMQSNQNNVYCHESNNARVKMEAMMTAKDGNANSEQMTSRMMADSCPTSRVGDKHVPQWPQSQAEVENHEHHLAEGTFGEGEEGLKYLHHKFRDDEEMMQKLNTASACFAAAGINRKEMDEYLCQLAKHIAKAPVESINKSPQRGLGANISPDKNEIYRCDSCDEKSYGSLYHLRRHQKTHGEVRPYECNVCPKAFFDLNKLKRHCMIHTGVKPYECHICDKKVSRPEHLKRHLLTHSELRPYRCSLCDFSARRNDSVRSHIKSKHPDAPLNIINMNELLGFTHSDDIEVDMRGQLAQPKQEVSPGKSKKSRSRSKKRSREANEETTASQSMKFMRNSTGKTFKPSQETDVKTSDYPPWSVSNAGQPISSKLSIPGSSPTAFSVPYSAHGVLPASAVVSRSAFPNLQMTLCQGNYLPSVRLPHAGAPPYFHESPNEAVPHHLCMNGSQQKTQTQK